MRIRRALAVKSISGLLLFAACAQSSTSNDASIRASDREPAAVAQAAGECLPTFLALPSGPIDVETGSFVFSLSYLLIGCRDDLEQLGESDRAAILDLLIQVSREKDLSLLAVNEDPVARVEAVERINQHLGQKVVGDVYFYLRSASESW